MAKRTQGPRIAAAVLLLAVHSLGFADDTAAFPQPRFSVVAPTTDAEARLFSRRLNAQGWILAGSIGYARQPYEGDPGEVRAFIRLVVPLRQARSDWAFRLRQWRSP